MDDASSIRSALHYVYPDVPYDLDNFHIIRDLMEMRQYVRNSLKSTITNRKIAQHLSHSIDTLVSWMQDDGLNMPELAPTLRYELFDFVLDELRQ